MSVEGLIAGTTAGPWTEVCGWCGGFSSGSAPDTISLKSIRSPGVPMATPVKASSGNAPITLIFHSYFFVLENKEYRHWDRSAAAISTRLRFKTHLPDQCRFLVGIWVANSELLSSTQAVLTRKMSSVSSEFHFWTCTPCQQFHTHT